MKFQVLLDSEPKYKGTWKSEYTRKSAFSTNALFFQEICILGLSRCKSLK